MDIDIVKSNKDIAEFLNFVDMGDKYGNKTIFLVPNEFRKINNNQRECSLEKLKFNTSWDWLIPVIDKITSDDNYQDYVEYSCSMFNDGCIHINTKYIDVTYTSVVDFINWYNNK